MRFWKTILNIYRGAATSIEISGRQVIIARNANGRATWKPWGEVQSITGTQANNLRFRGQYFQIETGLAYNWHRRYDPVTGRYAQPDRLRFVEGPSILDLP